MRQLISAIQMKVAKLFQIGKEVKITTVSNGSVLSMGRKDIMKSLFNDRKLVLLTSSYTVTEEDNGKIFFCFAAGGLTITLPTAAIGESWNIGVFCGLQPSSGNIDIVTTGSTNTINGGGSNAAGGAGTFATNADTIRFVQSQAVQGDYVNIFGTAVFGETWYFNSYSRVAAGITSVQAS